jgi:hypothetical protein
MVSNQYCYEKAMLYHCLNVRRHDSQDDDMQHNDTQQNNENAKFGITTLGIVTLNSCAEWYFFWYFFYYTECCNAECRGPSVQHVRRKKGYVLPLPMNAVKLRKFLSFARSVIFNNWYHEWNRTNYPSFHFSFDVIKNIFFRFFWSKIFLKLFLVPN